MLVLVGVFTQSYTEAVQKSIAVTGQFGVNFQQFEQMRAEYVVKEKCFVKHFILV